MGPNLTCEFVVWSFLMSSNEYFISIFSSSFIDRGHVSGFHSTHLAGDVPENESSCEVVRRGF